MFDKLKQRYRTRMAFLDAPVAFEVLGVQADERDVKWFRRNFGHQSLRAMFTLYLGYGLVMGIVGGLLVFSSILHATLAGLVLSGIIAFQLVILRYESKKV